MISIPHSSAITLGAALPSCFGKVRYSQGVPYNSVAIVTSEEARERDNRAIAAGTPSSRLMESAGTAASQSIMRRYAELTGRGVEVHAGSGNNGGDGWVVAVQLAKHGIPVRVIEAGAPKTSDAIAARSLALGTPFAEPGDSPAIIVDALLGTGSKGHPTGAIAEAIKLIEAARNRGAAVVALDIPSGLDATTGEREGCAGASLTLSFGALKRGQLISRSVCGEIEVLDIGLGDFGAPTGSDLSIASREWVSANIPQIEADAHKGTRRRLAIVGGDTGMAGAVILAGKGALRSGIGLLRMIVAAENRDAIYGAIPAAVTATHEELSQDAASVIAAADAIVIGPGLKPGTAFRLMESLRNVRVPMLLDAGALSAFENNRAAIATVCKGRVVVLTPHPAEMARMMGVTPADVLANRFEIGFELARETGATVLLKGTPTIISSAERRMVSAAGTPALATGGSGDLLSGIIGTLLAQTHDGFTSAVCGAWIHGRAAELCGPARGVTLEDILFAMPAAWRLNGPALPPPVLVSLPAVQ